MIEILLTLKSKLCNNLFSIKLLMNFCTLSFFFSNPLLSQIKTSNNENNKFFGHIVIISFDIDTINYKLTVPNQTNGNREPFSSRINNSTAISNEIIFRKDTSSWTKIQFTNPFVQEINFDNNYNYLYIRIHNGTIEKLIFSDEAREFW